MLESDFQTDDLIREPKGTVLRCYRRRDFGPTVWFEFGSEDGRYWRHLQQPVERVYLTTNPPPREVPEGMTLYERSQYGWYWSCAWEGCKAWSKDSDPMHDLDWCIDNAYGHAEEYHGEGK